MSNKKNSGLAALIAANQRKYKLDHMHFGEEKPISEISQSLSSIIGYIKKKQLGL